MIVERGIERGWWSYWVDSGMRNRERVGGHTGLIVERGTERVWGSYWVDSGERNRERVGVILG